MCPSAYLIYLKSSENYTDDFDHGYVLYIFYYRMLMKSALLVLNMKNSCLGYFAADTSEVII